MADNVNIALLGSKFMGRAHSNAWLKAGRFFPVDPLPVMHTVVARNAAEVEEFARTWGWQHSSTDWPAVVASDEIGLVDPRGVPGLGHDLEVGAGDELGEVTRDGGDPLHRREILRRDRLFTAVV
jgi:hypothetical protein